MDLPQDSIGPTDILANRDCPRRFSYGMRRHIGVGLQSDEMTPESGGWALDYGSAIHMVIHEIEAGETIDRAIEIAWDVWGRRLEPADIPALRADAEVYVNRDFPDTRTVLNEGEIRVPLMLYKGRMIYFRTRIDRLLERVSEPGTFVHVDFKSERSPKSEKEVRENLQLWMTNWAVHEFYPEVVNLVQFYDQLKFGQQRTRKTPEARRRIKDWIVRETTRILEDEDWREDGLLRPTKNEWCSWCPLLESCPLVVELSEWARVRIASLAPTVKRGRKTVMDLDPGKLEEYVERFADAKEAVKILERFEKAVRGLMLELPVEKRAALGYDTRLRKESSFSPEGLERLQEILGDRFFDVVKVTKTSLEAELAEDKVLLELALSFADEAVGSQILTGIR